MTTSPGAAGRWGLMGMLGLALACATTAHVPGLPPGYERDLAAWRTERLEGLRAPRGWLALAGFQWVKEGPATLGSAPGSTVLLPASAPARVGALTRTGDRFHLAVDEGVPAICQGAFVHERDLGSDAHGAPDVVEVGGVAFAVIVRGGEPALRWWDAGAPARAALESLPAYPVDPAWRLTGRWLPYDAPREVEVSTAIATTEKGRVTGEIRFTAGDRELTVVPLAEEGSEALFLVFGDLTNGHGTYGGGRFLDVDPPAPDGTVVLDFNRAVNPPCAFTPYATCPLPRPENRLPIAVTAGETDVE